MNSHAGYKVTCLAVAAGVVSVAALLLLETGAQQQEDRGRSRSVQTMVDDCKLLVLEPEAQAGGQSRRLGRDGGAPVPKQDDKRAAARPRRLVMNSIGRPAARSRRLMARWRSGSVVARGHCGAPGMRHRLGQLRIETGVG
jgi:hypothetical protein